MEQFISRPSVRLAALLITVITTRQLFEDGFHFPTFLLLTHTAIALTWKALNRSRHVTERPPKAPEHPHLSSIWLALYTASFIGALICGYQTLLHVKNTTLWMMIFSLHWDAVLPQNTRSLLEKSLSRWLFDTLRVSTFAMCVGLLYLQDHAMTSKYEYWELGTVGCIVIARRSFQEARAVSLGGWDMHAIALGFSLVPIMAIMIPKDWSNGGDLTLYGRLGLLPLNLPAGAIVLYGGVVLLGFDAGEGDADAHTSSQRELSWPCIAVSLVTLVELDNVLLQSRPTTTTIGQWIAFAVALLSMIDFERVLTGWEELEMPRARRLKLNDRGRAEPSGQTSDSEDEPINQAYDDDSAIPNRASAYCAWVLAIQGTLHALVWLLLLHDLFTNRKFKTAFSTNAGAPSRLDIVVARFEEPIEAVATAVASILQIPKISAIDTTVLIYNKGRDVEGSSHFPSASKVVVRQRENVGREGETILAHLLNVSYSFADHTLFMQAEPHELDQLVARIQQYFVEETEFLSLSYTGSFCSECDRCWDNTGWHEDAKDIYEQTNPGQECPGLSLTYRGQFIASRRRIESMDREVLKQARERLVDNEAFGYSLERLWGLVFRCPSISSSCPSLWSGQMGVLAPGSVGDCQCLGSERH